MKQHKYIDPDNPFDKKNHRTAYSLIKVDHNIIIL